MSRKAIGQIVTSFVRRPQAPPGSFPCMRGVERAHTFVNALKPYEHTVKTFLPTSDDRESLRKALEANYPSHDVMVEPVFKSKNKSLKVDFSRSMVNKLFTIVQKRMHNQRDGVHIEPRTGTVVVAGLPGSFALLRTFTRKSLCATVSGTYGSDAVTFDYLLTDWEYHYIRQGAGSDWRSRDAVYVEMFYKMEQLAELDPMLFLKRTRASSSFVPDGPMHLVRFSYAHHFSPLSTYTTRHFQVFLRQIFRSAWYTTGCANEKMPSLGEALSRIHPNMTDILGDCDVDMSQRALNVSGTELLEIMAKYDSTFLRNSFVDEESIEM